MFNFNVKLVTGAALAGVLLAGCGGDSSGPVVGTPPPTPPMETITAVAEYVRNLIGTTAENTEPIDINGLTLVADDTSAPAAVN